MKRIISFLCILLIVFTYQGTFAFAESTVISKEELGNGYYLITIIESVPSQRQQTFLNNSETKSKTSYLKNSNGETLWYVKVTGTFTYDGKVAKCTSAIPDAKSYNSGWTMSNVTGSKSGNVAKASATGNLHQNGNIVKSVSKSVSLTCSPDGQFS